MMHVIFAVLFSALLAFGFFVTFRKPPENFISENPEENSKNNELLNDKLLGISNQLTELSKTYEKSFGTNKNVAELLGKIGSNLNELKTSTEKYCKILTENGTDEKINSLVSKTQNAVNRMNDKYNELALSRKKEQSEISEKIDFLENCNEVSDEIHSIFVHLDNYLKEHKSPDPLYFEQKLSEIESILRMILSRLSGEVKDCVNLYLDTVYRKIDFIMTGNLERLNQTAVVFDGLYGAAADELNAIKEYDKRISNAMAENYLVNKKISDLINANLMLSSLFLKKYKFADGKLIDKLNYAAGVSKLDSEEYQLNVLSDKIETMNKLLEKIKEEKNNGK